MRRPGFTLIEILLAIGLLIMVLSLVGPALFSRIAPASFEYTTEQFAAEILLTREDARRTGQVRLIYAMRPPLANGAGPGEVRVESRLRPPADSIGGFGQSGAFDDGFAPSSSGSPSFGGTPLGGQDDEVPRLHMILPAGYDLVHTRPDFLTLNDGLSGMGGPSDADPETDPLTEEFADLSGIGGLPGGSQDAAESTLLAVCVPDGTVLLARPTWLTDPDQRAARLVIAAASGVVRLEVERRPTDPFGLDPLDQDPIGLDAGSQNSRDRVPGRARPESRTSPSAGGGSARPGGRP